MTSRAPSGVSNLELYTPLPWPRGRRRSAVMGLRALAAASPAAPPATHFLFGAMTTADRRRWAYRHTDHHYLRRFGA